MKTIKWLVCKLVAASVTILVVGASVCYAETRFYTIDIKCEENGIAPLNEYTEGPDTQLSIVTKEIQVAEAPSCDGSVCSTVSVPCNGMFAKAACGEEKYTDVKKPGTTLHCPKGEKLKLAVYSKKGVKLDGCKYLGTLLITRDDDTVVTTSDATNEGQEVAVPAAAPQEIKAPVPQYPQYQAPQMQPAMQLPRQPMMQRPPLPSAPPPRMQQQNATLTGGRPLGQPAMQMQYVQPIALQLGNPMQQMQQQQPLRLIPMSGMISGGMQPIGIQMPAQAVARSAAQAPAPAVQLSPEAKAAEIAMLKAKLAANKEKIAKGEEKIAGLNKKLVGHDEKIAGHDERIARHDARIAELDQRIDRDRQESVEILARELNGMGINAQPRAPVPTARVNVPAPQLVPTVPQAQNITPARQQPVIPVVAPPLANPMQQQQSQGMTAGNVLSTVGLGVLSHLVTKGSPPKR